MSLNIELDVSTLNERLAKVEQGQAQVITLLEHLFTISNNGTPSTRTSPGTLLGKRHHSFVIKQPNNGTNKPNDYQDIEKFVILPYLKEINKLVLARTGNELLEISDFFLKYFILKRMEQGLYNKTKDWSDIPQEIKYDALQSFEAFIRENLLFPFDKCENNWAGDYLLSVAWARHVAATAAQLQAAATSAAISLRQQQSQHQGQKQQHNPSNNGDS